MNHDSADKRDKGEVFIVLESPEDLLSALEHIQPEWPVYRLNAILKERPMRSDWGRQARPRYGR